MLGATSQDDGVPTYGIFSVLAMANGDVSPEHASGVRGGGESLSRIRHCILVPTLKSEKCLGSGWEVVGKWLGTFFSAVTTPLVVKAFSIFKFSIIIP